MADGALTEEDVAGLPAHLPTRNDFARAYENPRFVLDKGAAPVLAQVAPGGDIATVRDDGRLPGDSQQGFSVAFTGLLVTGQPVCARYCGVCHLWFGSETKTFVDNKSARKTHCRTDPGHVSRVAHAQQLARKRDSRAKTRATGRAEDSWENASERFRSESTSQWSDATSNTAERDHADRLQPRARTAQRAAITNTECVCVSVCLSVRLSVCPDCPPAMKCDPSTPGIRRYQFRI
eukprot:COSAG03_NODE_5442_length_1248_cov_1.981723_2_plen_235_part_00